MNRTDNYRVYKGADLTISSAAGNITNVEITGVSSNPASNMVLKEGSAGTWATEGNDGTWTGYATTLSLTASTAQARITEIVVTIEDGGTPVTYYNVTINEMSNGTVTANPTSAAEGETVTLTVEPDNGYQLASLTVEDENDVAISVSDNKFTMPAGSVYVSATFEEKPAANGDVLNQTITGVSGTSYSDWSGKEGDSGAVYAGNSAGGNSSIQLRSNNNNSGIVSTTSGGNVRKVTVTWNSNTASGRTLNVYGSNTAYTAASDLYDSSKQGTLIGTIVCGTSTELEITDDYAYVGLRSASGAMYLDEIVIEWEAGAAPAIATPVISGTTPFTDQTEVTITCATDGASVYYTIDGSDPSATDGTLYSAAFTIDASCTVKAIATDGTNVSAIASKQFEKTEPVVPITSLADVNALADDTEFTFGATAVVLGKKNRNMYIVTADNAAGTLLYASSNWDSGFTFGKEIAGGWSGTKTTYNTKPEITSPADVALSGNEVTLTPIEISAADLTLANFGRYAVLRSAVSDGSAITDANNAAVTTYNQFDVAVPATAGTYDIYGVIGWNNGAGQFMILSYEAVDVPEPTKYAIEIDAQIANGTVEADKAEAAEGETVTLTVTPATGYELEAITVLDANLEEVTVSNNAFTMPASDVLVSATFVEQGEQPQPGGTTVTDELTYDLIGVSGTNYSGWSNKTGTSGTVYAGNSAGGNNSIQLRSNNSTSGIVSTTSVGNVKSVTIAWNENTTSGRIVQIYGSNTAYESAADLYNSSKQGDKLGEINIDENTLTVTVDGDYAYVGIRSKSGALYLDAVNIEWEVAGSEPEPTEFYITATPPAGTYEGQQTVFLEGHNGEIDVATYTIDGNEDEIDYNPQTGILINKSCSLSVFAIDADGNEATLDAEYVINYPELEVVFTPEAGTYYEAQNVKLTVNNLVEGDEALISYTINGGAEQDYDAEAGIDVTESCTIAVTVVGTYQEAEATAEYVITEAPEPIEGNGFVKVQSNAELISGQYLIVYENVDETDPTLGYAFDGSLETLDAASNYQEVTIADGIIEATEANKGYAFTYDAEAGTLQSASGLYIGKTANSNGLDASDTNAYTNTISIDANANAEIKSSGNCYLMFNSTAGQTRFRYYKSQNQKAIALYILREEAQPEGISLAEALAGGEGLISNDLTVVKVYGGKAYLTDGEDNWVSIEGGNADQLTPGAVIDGYQLSGIANAGTSPAITISEDVTFTQGENIPTIDELDLRGGIAEMPKAGKVVSITGYFLQENGQNVFSAYSGANGSKGNTIPLADAGSMTVGSEYTIEAAITLTEAWDAEQSAGAPRRVSPTSDDALKNITLSLVGEPVSTAVNDIAVDADVVSVKYVNVAGQVSAQPFDGINVVVTTYVDGTTKAVKVVK